MSNWGATDRCALQPAETRAVLSGNKTVSFMEHALNPQGHSSGNKQIYSTFEIHSSVMAGICLFFNSEIPLNWAGVF